MGRDLRPMPAEAYGDGATTLTQDPVPRVLGEVRRLWMYSRRTPKADNEGRVSAAAAVQPAASTGCRQSRVITGPS